MLRRLLRPASVYGDSPATETRWWGRWFGAGRFANPVVLTPLLGKTRTAETEIQTYSGEK